MKYLKHFIIILMAFSSANAQQAHDIMRSSREITLLKGMESVSTLIIRDAKSRERIRKTAMASKTYEDQTEKRIIRFIEPADVKGMGMLIFDHDDRDDDMWVYLPANHQSRRIVSSEKSKSFMGSEFSNADMTAPNLSDFNFIILGEEIWNEKLCWKILIDPINLKKEDEYGFQKKISWVNQQDNMVLRSEYYDLSDELHKTLEVLDYHEVDRSAHKYIVTHMKITNEQNGRNSEMKMENIFYNPDVPDKYFTEDYLERP